MARVLGVLAVVGCLVGLGGAAAEAAGPALVRGTKAVGLLVGGGVQNNLLGYDRINELSLVNVNPRFSIFLLDPMGSGPLAGALETGLEGWFQQYVHPTDVTAAGLKLLVRYNFTGVGPLMGLGSLVPYVEGTAGMGGTSLRVREMDYPFVFVLEAGAGLLLFVTPEVAVSIGYRFHHISNGGLDSPNRGINADTGVLGVSYYFR